MKLFGLGSSLLLAGAILLPSAAKADTVFLSGGLLGPTGFVSTFVGAGPGSSFTATVQSNVYTTGSAGYTAYKADIGYAGTTDFIYAYIISNVVQVPADDSLTHFSVKSGTIIDNIGFEATGLGKKPSGTSTTFTTNATALFDFGTLLTEIQLGQKSTVLLFATSGPPVLQPASLSDGATDSELVVSAFSPGTPGTPLTPLPTTACAGMALLGLVSMGRRRKAKTA
jgi:hypothetical protein